MSQLINFIMAKLEVINFQFVLGYKLHLILIRPISFELRQIPHYISFAK